MLIDGFDVNIIRQDNVEKIYLERYGDDPVWMVYDRDVDGPIDEYLDNQK